MWNINVNIIILAISLCIQGTVIARMLFRISKLEIEIEYLRKLNKQD